MVYTATNPSRSGGPDPAHGRTEPNLTRERQAPCCGPGRSGRPRCRILCTGGAGPDRAGNTAGRLLPGMGRSIRKLASCLETTVDRCASVLRGHLRASLHGVGWVRPGDGTSVVVGKGVSVRVDPGGRGSMKKKKKK